MIHQTISGPIFDEGQGYWTNTIEVYAAGSTMGGGPSVGDAVFFLPKGKVRGYNGVGGSMVA